jgi:hypothetical protein
LSLLTQTPSLKFGIRRAVARPTARTSFAGAETGIHSSGCLCFLITALFVGLTRRGPNTNQQTADLAAVPESVDLWNAGTFRGEQPGPLKAVSLPAALVKVRLFFPGTATLVNTRSLSRAIKGATTCWPRPAQPQSARVTVKESLFISICRNLSLGAISFQ